MTGILTIRRPDDWHLHLRDDAIMKAVLPASSAHCGRALIMPNLVPPVVTAADAAAYRQRIMAALPTGDDFTPLMTLYLTEETDPDDVAAAAAEGLVHAVKLYPAGATTNSAAGVRDFRRVDRVLEKMAAIGLPLCVHGEVVDPATDIFDREAVFIEKVLAPLRRRHAGLKVVMEHITTADAVDYLLAGDETLAATVTTHHLLINRNHLLAGGIRPHYYCLPVAKREKHRLALRKLVSSGFARVFSGTDSAPHTDSAKLHPCGCAGVYSAPNSLACLAEVFEQEAALDRLEDFVAVNGAGFYGLALNPGSITLVREDKPQPLPAAITVGTETLTVFDPAIPVHWRVQA